MREGKKTILYIITQAEWGGAQRYIFDLASRLKNEYNVVIAVGEPEGKHDLLQKIKDTRCEMNIIQLQHLVRPISPIQDVLAIWELAKLYKTIKPDIVHVNSSKAGVVGSLARLLFIKGQMSIIYTAHGWAYLEPLPFYLRWVYLLMEKISARLRDTTIVLSEKEKKIALQHGTTKANSIHVIPNGIDLARLKFLSRDEARKKLEISDKKYVYVVGTIANLYKTKGLEFLAMAAKKVDADFFVIGDGAERKKLENFGTLNLLGAKDNAYQYLKAFDMFVLPSVKEGFPYVILEAMAAGLPIIVTSVGAIPEIIVEKENGLLVPPADSRALAQAINKLITEKNLGQIMGQKNLETIKKYSLENTVAQIKNIYQ